MNPLEEIENRLLKYPNAKYKTTDSTITVFPSSSITGFNVMLDLVGDSCTVSFNGWHENFSDASQALNCFAFGLSSECRLKEYRRGSLAYRWVVESKQNGEWVADSETGLFVFPFWKGKQVVFLQNDLIRGAEPPADIFGV